MIYALDELSVPPGRFGELKVMLLEDYVPLARGRGLTFHQLWQTPAVELDDAPTRLLALWSVPDVGAWWRARTASNPAVLDFWKRVDERVMTRSRRLLVAVDT